MNCTASTAAGSAIVTVVPSGPRIEPLFEAMYSTRSQTSTSACFACHRKPKRACPPSVIFFAVSTSSDQVLGGCAPDALEQVGAVVEHAGIEEPGKRGQLAVVGAGLDDAGEVGLPARLVDDVVERQCPAGGRELRDPDDVLREHVGRAAAPRQLLHQPLVDLGGSARRRQLDIGHMDPALRLVEGLDHLGDRLLAEELGAGEGDLGPVLAARRPSRQPAEQVAPAAAPSAVPVRRTNSRRTIPPSATGRSILSFDDRRSP